MLPCTMSRLETVWVYTYNPAGQHGLSYDIISFHHTSNSSPSSPYNARLANTPAGRRGDDSYRGPLSPSGWHCIRVDVDDCGSLAIAAAPPLFGKYKLGSVLQRLILFLDFFSIVAYNTNTYIIIMLNTHFSFNRPLFSCDCGLGWTAERLPLKIIVTGSPGLWCYLSATLSADYSQSSKRIISKWWKAVHHIIQYRTSN